MIKSLSNNHRNTHNKRLFLTIWYILKNHIISKVEQSKLSL